MSTTHEPGTVAVATVREIEGVRVSRYPGGWAVLDDPNDIFNDADHPGWVTDVRPLVVLDLDEIGAHLHPKEIARGGVAAVLRDTASITACKIADAIEAATKPPRIPEPGWGEKITAHVATPGVYRHRQKWVAVIDDTRPLSGPLVWVSEQGDRAAWSDLIDPELVTS